MRRRILLNCKQIILIVSLIISCQYILFSQETKINIQKNTGLYIGISLGQSKSQIINTETSSVSSLTSNKTNSTVGAVEIGYLLSENFGLSSGIGFSSYGTNLKLDNYQCKIGTLDSENESYELNISGFGISEEQLITYINIPLNINLQIPFSKKFGFIFSPGINVAFPIGNSYQNRGTFSYKGYYASYNVLFENLPEYGFPSNLSCISKGQLELKPFAFNALVTSGFYLFIKNKVQIAITASYNKSLSAISNYPSPNNFRLSSEVNEINSLMGGSSKTTVQSMGVQIILRYFLIKKV